MRVENIIKVDNIYSGSNWNYEKTKKYIFSIGDNQYEAGYFEHYKDKAFVKAVIELPVSYGCPAGCYFCASSRIERFLNLSADDIFGMFEHIYDENGLVDREYVLVTMTGTGDIYYNLDNTFKFLKEIQKYPNVYVTLSSCLWDESMLQYVETWSSLIRFRFVQVTFISDRADCLRQIVPAYRGRQPNILQVANYIRRSEQKFYRINYIMIKEVNDSKEDFAGFKDAIIGIREKIVVRISRLNETSASGIHHLYPTDLDKMEELCNYLLKFGITGYVFYAAKNDNMNCGQLVTEAYEE